MCRKLFVPLAFISLAHLVKLTTSERASRMEFQIAFGATEALKTRGLDPHYLPWQDGHSNPNNVQNGTGSDLVKDVDCYLFNDKGGGPLQNPLTETLMTMRCPECLGNIFVRIGSTPHPDIVRCPSCQHEVPGPVLDDGPYAGPK